LLWTFFCSAELSSAGVTRYESRVNLVDMARLLPGAAIGLRADENKNNGRKEQRKRETNMAEAGARELECQVGLLVRATDGEGGEGAIVRGMSSQIAVAQCNLRAPVSFKQHLGHLMTCLLPTGDLAQAQLAFKCCYYSPQAFGVAMVSDQPCLPSSPPRHVELEP
jgi:hypothetical protein